MKKIGIFLVILSLQACYKSTDPNAPAPLPTNPNSCSYLPYRVGTKLVNTNNNIAYSYEIMKDTIIDSVKYMSVLNRTLNATSFIRLSASGEIWQHIPETVINGVQIPAQTNIYLKTAAPVGETWTDTLVTPTYTTIKTYKVLTKGYIDSVLGQTYPNCTSVEQTSKSYVGTTLGLTQVATYRYACGLGQYAVESGGIETSRLTAFTY